MPEETQVETEEVVPTATEAEPSQEESDPIKEELDKVNTGKRTKKEKLLFSRKRIDEQLAEMGDESQEDDRPLTLKEYQALRVSESKETAISLVDGLDADENEKELTKHYLENTIKPSGDAQTDLRNARALVHAVKNRQLAEESARTAKARIAPSAAGAPPKQEGKEPELPKEYADFAKRTGLAPEQVAAAFKE